MNIEDITKVVTEEGIDRVNAALQTLGYRAYKITPNDVIADDDMSTGSIRLVDVGGRSIPNHEIVIEPVPSDHSVSLEGSTYHPNLVLKTYRVFTDENGVASIPLIKGSKVRVYVSKSSYFREIIVPDNDFNLLDPELSTSADTFSSPVVAPTLTIRGDI